MFGLIRSLFAKKRTRGTFPTSKQLEFAKDLGIKVGKDWDRERTSKAIDEILEKPDQLAKIKKKRAVARAKDKADKRTDLEKFGDALLSDQDKWEGLEGEFGLLVYRKKGEKVFEIVRVGEIELHESKTGPYGSIEFIFPKIVSDQGVRMVDFEDRITTIRASDVLHFERAEAPIMPDELKALREWGEKRAKKI